VVGFVPEFWGAFPADANKDGKVTDEELLQWNDEKLEGKYFIKWQPYNHPQLGAVEIGGWNTRYIRQNPPPAFIKGEIEMYVPWMLWLAETSPRVVIRDSQLTPLDKGKLFRLAISIENEGHLPTNITRRAVEAQFAAPVRASINLFDAELVTGSPRTDLGHLTGRRDGEISTSRSEVVYVIRSTGNNPRAVVTIISEKGGTTKKEFSLKQ
jgi:hypothetical protein